MTAWADAIVATRLLAADPGLGGINLRAWPGPARDRFLAAMQAALPVGAPWRRLPASIADDRLLGGLDLPATLASGRPVFQRGVLAEANGGVVVLPMAERAGPALAGRLAAAMEDGAGARFTVVALDEGAADEAPPQALLERLAFHIDLSDADTTPQDTRDAPGDPLETLCIVSVALGIDSARATVFAMRAARVSALLGGRDEPDASDVALAARLVLAPRATRLPASPEPEPESREQEQAESQTGETTRDDPGTRPMADVVLSAARAAIPPGLLASLTLAAVAKRAAAGAGAETASPKRGRPAGSRPGDPRRARLDLIQTLRAAAPWQSLRGREGPMRIRAADLRIRRFRQRTQTTTIFVVDASGSAALNRLGEAKGAVELVLAECYVRRDQVALLAFRGDAATLILPPTSSLARARRALAGLPGGGATPLATALDTAMSLADLLRRRGQTPVLVVLSDGRANVARDGTQGRPKAEADAIAAATLIRAQGVTALLVDTSPRPAAAARAVAEAMGARYLPLPYADARAVSRAVADAA